MPKLLCLSALLAGVLVGCATTPSGPVDEDSPTAEIPPGSVFVLQRDIEVAKAGKQSILTTLGLPSNPDAPAIVTIQGGEIIERDERARRSPFCDLETTLPRRETPTIGSGRFVAGRSTFKTDSEASLGGDDRTYITRIPLQSEEQPGVTALLCQTKGVPVSTRHLTIRQIRTILGEVITLELVEAQP